MSQPLASAPSRWSSVGSFCVLACVSCAAANPGTAHAKGGGYATSVTLGLEGSLSFVANVEFRLSPRVSTSVFAGFGGAYVGGIQSRYYLLGNFEHGMPIALDVRLLGSDSGGVMYTGLLLGYKKVFGFGLTLDALGGLRALTSSTDPAYADLRIGFVLDPRIGWSF